MEQKHIRSEQEWMELIQACRTSGLSDKEWCLQHSIPVSTFYNKLTKLRKKACAIPESQKGRVHAPQEVVPLEILEETGVCREPSDLVGNLPAVHVPTVTLSIHGYSIGISNHAARETVLNVLSVLQQLC